MQKLPGPQAVREGVENKLLKEKGIVSLSVPAQTIPVPLAGPCLGPEGIVVEFSRRECGRNHSPSHNLFLLRIQTGTLKMITYPHRVLILSAEFKDLKTSIKSLFTRKEDGSEEGAGW